MADVLVQIVHFRLCPRWRACDSEGDRDGQRYVQTPFTGRLLNRHPEKLKDSKFNTPEDLASFSRKFDEGVKKVFSTSNRHANQYIKLGSPGDNEPNFAIKAGRLVLTG